MYTTKQLIKIVKGQTYKLYNREYLQIVRRKRLAKIGIPRVHRATVIRSNKRYYRYLLLWRRRMRRRRYYRNFYRKYVRQKNKDIIKVLSESKPHIITFKAFFSNFYIMLTDYMGNPLISCCTGQVAKSRSKKRKNSLTLIHPMMRRVKLALLRHRVKHLVIHIKTDISAKVMTAMKFLYNSKYKFEISYIALLKPIPHHFGRRKRKPRRV